MKNKYIISIVVIAISSVFFYINHNNPQTYLSLSEIKMHSSPQATDTNTKKLRGTPELKKQEIPVLRAALAQKPIVKHNTFLRGLIIQQPSIKYYYHDYGYIQGMLTGADSMKADIYVNGEKIYRTSNRFSTFARRPLAAKGDSWQAEVQARYPDGEVVNTHVTFEALLSDDYRTGEKYMAPSEIAVIDAGSNTYLQVKGANLQIIPGAVKQQTILSATALREEDMPVVNSYIANVTGSSAGYRFLPDGTQFEKELVLAMEYDKSKIPSGYTVNEIYTFYYNESQRQWQQIPRDSINEAKGIIYSRTNHFTDYVNGVLKVPEASDAMANTPTSIKDLEAIHPLTGLSQMSPPEPNQKGTANLNYPLNLPSGRQGMQPSLNLTYNSAGGSSWLGLGWDLNIPSISVETRWGVPNYDSEKESETYLLDGETLVTSYTDQLGQFRLNKPAYRRDWDDRYPDGTQFYPRVEGAFRKIIRHGTSPKNYWWEVIEKNGTRFFYGKSKTQDNVDGASVLQDPMGNIAKWGLTEVRDMYGNNITYTYIQRGHSSGGKQLLPNKINYTGKGQDKGMYEVRFVLSLANKPDVSSSCRYGFEEANAWLLDKVQVLYDGSDTLKEYYFGYKKGAFDKTLLCNVIEAYDSCRLQTYQIVHENHAGSHMGNKLQSGPFDRCDWDMKGTNADMYVHLMYSFDYNELPSALLGPAQTIPTPSGGTQDLCPYPFLDIDEVGNFGASKSKNWNVGGGLDLGLDWFVFMKSISAGGNYAYSKDNSEGLLALIDLNGDGYPDKLIKEDGILKYRLQTQQNGVAAFGLKTNLSITGTNDFQKSSGSTDNWGLEGQAGISFGMNWSDTRTTTSVYIADVNGDGLADIIDNGRVFVNRPDANNKPVFADVTDSELIWVGGSCGGYISNDENLNQGIFESGMYTVKRMVCDSVRRCIDERDGWRCWIELNNCREVIDTFYYTLPPRYQPDIDMVRVWIAPYDGLVSVSSTAKLSDDFQQLRQASGVTDGVLLSIQRSRDTVYKYLVLIPESGTVPFNYDSIQVRAGDKLYFRMQSKEYRKYDKVNWNPYVRYLKAVDRQNNLFPASMLNSVDANGDSIFRFNYSDDFMLNTQHVVQAPFICKFRFDVKLKSGKPLTENLTLTLKRKRRYFVQISNYVDTIENNSDVTSYQFNRGTVLSTNFSFDTTALKEDKLYLVLSNPSGVQLKWSDIEADIKAYIVESYDPNYPQALLTDTYSEPGVTRYTYTYYPAIKKTAYSYAAIPSQAWTSTVSGPAALRLNIGILPYASYVGNVPLIMSLRDETGAILQAVPIGLTYSVQQGVYVFAIGSQTGFTATLTAGRKYYIDYHCYNPEFYGITTTVNTLINGAFNVKSGLYSNYPSEYEKFGPLYRGWGQFGYKHDNSPTGYIKESLLTLNSSYTNPVLPQGQVNIDPSAVHNPEAVIQGAYNPLNDNFFMMYADPKHKAWTGYGDIVYAQRETIGNININEGEDYEVDLTQTPMPVRLNGERLTAPNKMVVNKGFSTTGSVSIGPLSLGGSYSEGDNRVLSDFIDVNGDRFPDAVSECRIQYSKQKGGLSANIGGYSGEIDFSSYTSTGFTFGASFLQVNKQLGNDPKKSKVSITGSAGLSAGTTKGDNDTEHTLMDINGDGLPDKVYANGRVALNAGYSFLPVKNINFTQLRKAESEASSLSLSAPSLNMGGTSLSIGASGSKSENKGTYMLADVNGDGLPDIISGRSVQFGNGFSFSSYSADLGENCIDHSIATNTNANGAITIGITLGFLPIKIVVNPKSGYCWGDSQTQKQWTDMNNDGYPDYVFKDGNNIKVRYSQIGKTNLLKKAGAVTGAVYYLDYSLSESSPACPQRHWNLASLKVFDGLVGDGVDTMVSAFEYKNRYYDRYEREDFGYETVVTKEYLNNSVYRVKTKVFHNNNYVLKGLLKKDLVADAAGKKYVENTNEYKAAEITTGNYLEGANVFCTGDAFAALAKQQTLYYEGLPTAQITTEKQFTYTSYGNVESYSDLGDINVSGDELTVQISYGANDPNLYLVELPDEVNIYDGQGLQRQRRAGYNSQGSLQWMLVNGLAEYNFEYDGYGNRRQATLPTNNNGQRLQINYTYDNILHCLPVTTTNSYGYTATAQYEYKWGKPTEITDIGGSTTRYTYDDKGRVRTIQAPNEAANRQPYTIQYQYWDRIKHNIDATNVRYMRIIPFALTNHYDGDHQGNDIQTVSFCDGLGRVAQIKKDIELNGQEARSVSGWIFYDGLGRAVKTYPLGWEPNTYLNSAYGVLTNNNYDCCSNYFLFQIANYTANLSGITNTSVPPSQTTYDVMDRPLHITNPDQTTRTNTYGVGSDAFGNKCFLTTLRDENGNYTNGYTDAKGLQTTLKTALNTQTLFRYDALGQLAESTDPEGNTTTHTYDAFGRRTQRKHPASGNTFWEYDPTGNITRQTMNTGENIAYEYDYNHLTAIHYSDNWWNNSYYEYGGAGSGTGTGRVIRMQDATGVQEFEYGNMGEQIMNRHTYIVPGSTRPFTLQTKWKYDSWNRVKNIIYPDGESVQYGYDYGGLLKIMDGNKYGNNHVYIEIIEYDEYGQRTRIGYGNGVVSTYQYNPYTRRLEELATLSQQTGQQLQKNEYYYDNVGNIIGISGYGLDNFYHKYNYDNIYRLINAEGDWNNGMLNYEQKMDYSPAGKILHKYISGTSMDNNGFQSIKIDNKYDYNHPNPYAVGTIDNTALGYTQNLEWDGKGNLAVNANLKPWGDRRLCWTEDNRLQAVVDNNRGSYYNYNAEGTRNLKLTGGVMNIWQNGYMMNIPVLDQQTLYANPLITLNDKGYTKHYFTEGQRIASKIGDGEWAGDIHEDVPMLNDKQSKDYEEWLKQQDQIVEQGFKCMGTFPQLQLQDLFYLVEKQNQSSGNKEPVFFYHGDHLGSSSYITEEQGQVTQTLAYLPFGENFVDLSFGYPYETPYKFNGKEKDEETGYNYYEARYYGSDLSIFLSVDPLQDKYPGWTPYNYCGNNPIRITDPTGMEWEIDGVKYQPGQVCPEDAAQNTKDKWNTMNKIYSTKNGKKAINEMNKEGVLYKVSSESHAEAKEGGGSYLTNGDGTGGTIYLNGKNEDVGSLSHEMFHGYQDMNGQGGTTIQNEIEARLFGNSVSLEWMNNNPLSPNVGCGDQLRIPKGDKYEVFNSHVDKLESKYSNSSMNYLISTFKNFHPGYKNSPANVPSKKSLIRNFYPL